MSRINGRDLGPNLMILVKRLLKNQNLCKLLYYQGRDPLADMDITDTGILLHKQLRVIPQIGIQEESESKVALILSDGDLEQENIDYKNITLQAYIYTPLDQWLIRGENFRPYLIMTEIQDSLIGTQFKGLGKINGGDFHLDMITNSMSLYVMNLYFTTNA